MVLIRAETVVPYGCTCDGSAVAKEYDGVRIRGALLPSYPKAFKELKAEGVMPGSCELRQSKYLNNLVAIDTTALKISVVSAQCARLCWLLGISVPKKYQ